MLLVALKLVLLSGVGAVEDFCTFDCLAPTASSIYKYESGKEAKYTYRANATVKQGTLTTTSTIKGTVFLSRLRDCQMKMMLRDFTFTQVDKAVSANLDLGAPIRFTLNPDGSIEDSICVNVKDTMDLLDLKHSIVSLFQTKFDTNLETNYQGQCPVTMSKNVLSATKIKIGKIKNLKLCSERTSVKYLLLPYTYKSRLLKTSNFYGTYIIDNGVLQSAAIVETYTSAPLTPDNSPISVTVSADLILSDYYQGSVVSDPTNATYKLLPYYFWNATEKTPEIIVQAVLERSPKILDVMRMSLRSRLVGAYKRLNATDRPFFIESLINTKTICALEAIVELYPEFNAEQKDNVINLLFFIEGTSNVSVAFASGLLDDPSVSNHIILGVGGHTGRYAATTRCYNETIVNDVLSKLITMLDQGDVVRKVAALKALANFHHLPSYLIVKVIGYAQNKATPLVVRIEALATYLADPCNVELRSSALAIFKDSLESADVRYQAYLVLAQCPNEAIVLEINQVLSGQNAKLNAAIKKHVQDALKLPDEGYEHIKLYLGKVNIGLVTRSLDYIKSSWTLFDNYYVISQIQILIQNAFTTSSSYKQLFLEMGIMLFGCNYDFDLVLQSNSNASRCLFESFNFSPTISHVAQAIDVEENYPTMFGYLLSLQALATVSVSITGESFEDIRPLDTGFTPFYLKITTNTKTVISNNVFLNTCPFTSGVQVTAELSDASVVTSEIVIDNNNILDPVTSVPPLSSSKTYNASTIFSNC